MSLDNLNKNRSQFSYKNVKAYPSINSANGGSIHSEENTRWLFNRLCNKPFIVGFSNEEIDGAFAGVGAGNGRYPYSGMINIDGYLIKIADQNNISFDDTTRTRIADENTQNVQRFIEDMFDAEHMPETDINNIVYNKYKTDYTTSKDVWINLDPNVLNRVGYIDIHYSDAAWQDITNTFSIELAELSSQFKIDEFDQQTDISIVDSANKTISYPVIYKNVENKSNGYTPSITFTDIFSLEYVLDVVKSDTMLFPATHSRYSSIFEDDNISDILGIEDTTNISTIDNIYDYTYLYEKNDTNRTSIRKNVLGDYDADEIKTSIADSAVSIQTVLNANFLNVDAQYILDNNYNAYDYDINGSITYYCISDSDISGQMRIGNNLIPISLISSTGELTPYGAFGQVTSQSVKERFNSQPVSTTYPVDGYMTWLKRLYYWKNNEPIILEEVTIEQINSVSVDDVMNDSECYGLYLQYVAPAINLFIQMAYSAHGDKNLCFIANDYNKFKANNSGYAIASGLAGSDRIVENTDFGVSIKSQNKKKCVCESSVININDYERTLNYAKDESTDRTKLKNGVSVEYLIDSSYKIFNAKYIESDLDITAYSDPINYLRHCVSDSEAETKVTSFPVMVVASNGKIVNTEQYVGNDNDNFILNNVHINEFLVPVISYYAPKFNGSNNGYVELAMQLNAHISVTESNYRNTGCSGLNYSYNILTWVCKMPYVARVFRNSQGFIEGKDVTGETDNYTGLVFDYSLPRYITDKDLKILDMYLSTVTIVGDYDIESVQAGYDSSSKTIHHNKESIIHFSKLYGDNGEDLKTYIESISHNTVYEDVLIPNIIAQYPILYVKDNRYYNLCVSGNQSINRLDIKFNKNESSISGIDDNKIKAGMSFTIRTNKDITKNLVISIKDDDGQDIECRFNAQTITSMGTLTLPITQFSGDVEITFMCVNRRYGGKGNTSHDKFVFDVLARDMSVSGGRIVQAVKYLNTVSTVNVPSANDYYIANGYGSNSKFLFDLRDIQNVGTSSPIKFNILANQRYYFNEENPSDDRSIKLLFKTNLNVFIDSDYNYFKFSNGDTTTVALNPYERLYELGNNTSSDAPSMIYSVTCTIAENNAVITIDETTAGVIEPKTKYRSLEALNAPEISNYGYNKYGLFGWLANRRDADNYTNINIGDYIRLDITPNSTYEEPLVANAVVSGINHNGSNGIDFILDTPIKSYSEVYISEENDERILADYDYIRLRSIPVLSDPIIVNSSPFIYRIVETGNVTTTQGKNTIALSFNYSDSDEYTSKVKISVVGQPGYVNSAPNFLLLDTSFGVGNPSYIKLEDEVHYSIYSINGITIFVDELDEVIKSKLLSGEHTNVVLVLGNSEGGFNTNSNVINFLNSKFYPVCMNSIIDGDLTNTYRNMIKHGFESVYYGLLNRLKYEYRTYLTDGNTYKTVYMPNTSCCNIQETTTTDKNVVYPDTFTETTYSPFTKYDNEIFELCKLGHMRSLWIPYEQEIFDRTFTSSDNYTQHISKYPVFNDKNNMIFNNLPEGTFMTASPKKDSYNDVVVLNKKNGVIYTSDDVSTDLTLVGFTI